MREPDDMVTQRCGEGLPAVLGLMQPGIWRWEKIGGDGKGNAAVWWLAKLLRNSVKWCGETSRESDPCPVPFSRNSVGWPWC